MKNLKTYTQLFESDIHSSILYKNTDYFFKIIDNPDIDINEVNLSTNTALIIAAMNGIPKIVKKLIEKGANLDIQNREGFTALIAAAKEYHQVKKEKRKKDFLDIIKMLIEAGADWNIEYLSYKKSDFLMYFNKYEEDELIELYPNEHKNYLKKQQMNRFNL